MRLTLISAALVVALTGSTAFAQPYGTGPGMLGGGGGYGMGPGMMGGHGPGGYGMGPGMMGGGYAAEALMGLDLSAEQRKQIAQIQQEAAQSRRQLMGTMHSQESNMHWMFGAGPLDEAAARKAFDSMAATHKAMFELSLGAQAHRRYPHARSA
jgi:Spy/CpxP family protein refolding chaperone